jgi:methylated-DNA-[protein]-cysteine S-methyltransferase
MVGCALFPTRLGDCGLAWDDAHVTAVLLAAASIDATHAALRRRAGGAAQTPPPWPAFVQHAVASMQALLRGEPADLNAVPIDLDRIDPFERRVYEAARRLRPGQTCTYGDIAHALGDPESARAVGAALGRNPWPLLVPCHRVLGAGGKLVGFSAPGGVETKRRLLALEAETAAAPGRLL